MRKTENKTMNERGRGVWWPFSRCGDAMLMKAMLVVSKSEERRKRGEERVEIADMSK